MEKILENTEKGMEKFSAGLATSREKELAIQIINHGITMANGIMEMDLFRAQDGTKGSKDIVTEASRGEKYAKPWTQILKLKVLGFVMGGKTKMIERTINYKKRLVELRDIISNQEVTSYNDGDIESKKKSSW